MAHTDSDSRPIRQNLPHVRKPSDRRRTKSPDVKFPSCPTASYFAVQTFEGQKSDVERKEKSGPDAILSASTRICMRVCPVA